MQESLLLISMKSLHEIVHSQLEGLGIPKFEAGRSIVRIGDDNTEVCRLFK